MVSETFKRGKEALFNRLRKGEVLTPEIEREIMDVYGGRGKRALAAIKGRRVIKRGQRWFVRGMADEYEVVKNFCTCRDYVLNITTGKVDVDCCYHALAKTVCEALNSYYVLQPEG
ncbi:MAG: SWIM zinc finger family protein [Hadesarchaea archaeon]|nr:SWIM zinc finger family protein [Hadesarchaea archaeon]